MAKGSVAKQEVFAKVLEMFPGSFMYNGGKEVRINMVEDGQEVQIKMTLTAAKTPVESGEDTAIPGEKVAPMTSTPAFVPNSEKHPVEGMTKVKEPTEAEKKNVSILLESLGL